MKIKLDIWRLVRKMVFATLATSLLCCYIVGVQARYSSRASGTDAARVAGFHVSAAVAEEQATSFSLTQESDTAMYAFDVESDSEVAVEYDIIVSWTGAFPAGVTLQLDSGEAITPSGSSHTFLKAGSFAAGSDTNPHTITIKASNFDSNVTLNSILVRVKASQVD